MYKIGVNTNLIAHTLHITGNFCSEGLEILIKKSLYVWIKVSVKYIAGEFDFWIGL